jgi:multisubunit Na+/H+ antiporter MnhG subunit
LKLKNVQLGLALADAAVGDVRQTEMMQLADFLLTHPVSKIHTERALHYLGIDPNTVPSEIWSEDTPTEAHGAAALKDAITLLNVQWSRHKLARMVAVRNLAWQATQLARRLEKDAAADAERVIKANGGSSAGLLRSFITAPVTSLQLKDAAQQEQQHG